MKKIILSVAVATMALSTAAAALENIKVSGQAKLWYESNNKGSNTIGSENNSVAAQTFALKVTGKQGNVGFGVKVIDSSNVAALGSPRDNTDNDGLTVSEMYITAPLGSSTSMKVGKQQVQTPLVFSENWMAVPNTVNAALVINKSIANTTLVGAYIGQGNADNSLSQATGAGFKVNEDHSTFANGKDTYTAAAHYKNSALAANLHYFSFENTATALWLDASAKMGPVKVKGIAAQIKPDDTTGYDDTKAYAVAVAGKAGSVALSAAYSTVNDDSTIPMGNFATNFKKTKLPTAGVYTDGLFVAQPGSDAIKVKAVTKLAGAKVIVQGVKNSNDKTASKETTEVDLIVIKKLGDVNLKGILLNRSFDDDATDTSTGGTHFRLIASVNF